MQIEMYAEGWQWEEPPAIHGDPKCWCTNCGKGIRDTSTATVQLDMSLFCLACEVRRKLREWWMTRVAWARPVQPMGRMESQRWAVYKALGDK